jgi:hydroxypyruvate reductase
VVALILSDVIGDRLDVIGSGLTSPDPSTFDEAENVLKKYALLDLVLSHCWQQSPSDCGCSRPSALLGYHTTILSTTLQGETREVAGVHAEILREVVSSGNPIPRPACLLSAGETTVTVRDNGKGGRNQEFGLAAAIAIAGLPHAVVLAAGTDGTDGPTDAAGALVDSTTAARALAGGFSPVDYLNRNDFYPLLDAVGDLLKTGSTETNVMDLNVMLADDGAVHRPDHS